MIYAATEAPMMQWYVDETFRGDDPRVPIGFPLPGNRLSVVDEDGRPARPGDLGELVVCSRYVALGLWANGRFVRTAAEVGDDPDARIFRTGDVVRQRPDGLLERFGRKDRQVKICGSRVDLDGVESALRQHAFVEDAGAVARTNGPDDAVSLIAYVSVAGGSPSGLLQELKQTMRAAPPEMRPSRLYLVSSIPRLPSSKLDVRALMALDEVHARGEHTCEAAASEASWLEGDAIALTVAQAWRTVLGAPVCDPMDDFFEAGGDLLKALGFTLEVEQALGLGLPVTLINEVPTFGRFCDALRDNRAAIYTPLVVLKAGERRRRFSSSMASAGT